MRKPTTLLVRLILSVLLTAAAMCGANGESAGTSSSLPPLASSANGVTPEQARRTLEVLEDDGKRARTIEILRVIGGVLPPTQATPSDGAPAQTAAKAAAETTAPAGEPARAATPDSLGAQILVQTSEWIGAVSDNIQATARAVTHFPLLWRWIEQTANDPYARDLVARRRLEVDRRLRLCADAGVARQARRAAAHGRAREPCRARAPQAARARHGCRRFATKIASRPDLVAAATPAAGGGAPPARPPAGAVFAAAGNMLLQSAGHAGDDAARNPGSDQCLRDVPGRDVHRAHARAAPAGVRFACSICATRLPPISKSG